MKLIFHLPEKYNEHGAINDSHIYFEGLSVHHLVECVLHPAWLSNSKPQYGQLKCSEHVVSVPICLAFHGRSKDNPTSLHQIP